MSGDDGSPLQRSLSALSRFVVSERSVADSLMRVAQLAVACVVPAELAGITVILDERVTTRAFTDPVCSEIDQAQDDSGRGPGLEAFRRGLTIVVDSLEGDDRWPEFAATALAHGIRSTLSVPMAAGEATLGALNLYAATERAFGEVDAQAGRLFAERAAVVLTNAHEYWGARATRDQLQAALQGRQPIDLAKGIIMGVVGCGPDEAFDLLASSRSRRTASCATSLPSSCRARSGGDLRVRCDEPEQRGRSRR